MHAHVSLVFRFPTALVFWAVYLLVFLPEFVIIRRARKQRAGAQDGGTLRLIMIGQQAALLAGFAASFLPWGLMARPEVALALGTSVLLAGGIVRQVCFRSLGRYFTGAVVVVPEQPVVERGPYRWVRHPSYTAGMMMFAGIAVALGSWLSVAVLVVVPSLVYWRRVRVEEAALLETIGEPYRAYMARTARFIPFVV